MQLNAMFKVYKKTILPAYQKADGNSWKKEIFGVTVIYIWVIIYYITLLFEVNWPVEVEIIWMITLVLLVIAAKLYGKKADGQNYPLKIKKRNILVYKFLSEYMDFSDAEQRKNLQDLVRDTYPKTSIKFDSILSEVIVPIGVCVLNNVLMPENKILQRLNINYETLLLYFSIAIFVLVLIAIYCLIGYFESNKGKKYYFAQDMLDVLTFHELAKKQYEEYMVEKDNYIREIAENNSLERMAENIDMVIVQ